MTTDPAWDIQGRRVLITGGTSGIGAVAARELARQGARVVIVGRDPARCAATQAELAGLSAPDAPPEHLVVDLATVAGVDRLADAVLDRFDRLDVLINNAGAMFAQRQTTADGFERTFALNHLAYFQLTERLRPLLVASGPARIVNVASDAHRAVRQGLDFADLMWSRRRYRGFPVYCASKLANVLFTRGLARRLEGTGVTANCLHPGFVRTRFTAGNGALGLAMRGLAAVLAISPEAGAATTIHLASAPEVSDLTGGYFAKCRPVTPTAAALDDAAAERLWSVTEELLRAARQRAGPTS